MNWFMCLYFSYQLQIPEKPEGAHVPWGDPDEAEGGAESISTEHPIQEGACYQAPGGAQGGKGGGAELERESGGGWS